MGGIDSGRRSGSILASMQRSMSSVSAAGHRLRASSVSMGLGSSLVITPTMI